jgi:hypothetical protein
MEVAEPVIYIIRQREQADRKFTDRREALQSFATLDGSGLFLVNGREVMVRTGQRGWKRPEVS